MIDITNVDWNAFGVCKSGKSYKLMYNKEPVKFCTSSLYSPFGVKSSIKEWSNFKDYYIDASLDQSALDSAKAFRDFLEKLDEKIKELVENNKELLGLTEVNITPILRENGAYPKLVKMQMTRDKLGNFSSFVFDAEKEKIKLDEGNIENHLCKGKLFKCILECARLWVYNGKVGTIWNVVQLKFTNKKVLGAVETEERYGGLMIED
jgi:hypothetical protein